MMFRIKHVEQIAGLFVMAMCVIAVLLVVYVAKEQEWFANRYIIKAVFGHGNDLQRDTVVTMEGIDIGKVETIGFNEQNKIVVELSIKERFRKQIRGDSFAAIMRPNVLGNPILEISLGSPKEKVLEEGDYIKVREVAETTMKDIIYVSNNLVQVLKDFVNPQGPYQKVLSNIERITSRLEKSDSSIMAMFSDNGKMYKDSTEILAYINDYLKTNSAVPIELSKKSQLVVNLSEKLEKQSEIAFELARKMDIISERLVTNQGMAGAMISDKELYVEMIRFMRESKDLLDSLNQLAKELKLVIPKLPELIDSAKRGTKDMEEVMGVIKRMPLINSGIREQREPAPIEIQGRINKDREQ